MARCYLEQSRSITDLKSVDGRTDGLSAAGVFQYSAYNSPIRPSGRVQWWEV